MAHSKYSISSFLLLALVGLAMTLATACGNVLQSATAKSIGSASVVLKGSIKAASPQFSLLFGISAVSSKDIWAVGRFSSNPNRYQTLTEHWNGTTWSLVASPNTAGSFNQLNGVTAIAHDNAWAVGQSGQNQPLIEHWNGKSWSIASSPAIASGALRGVTALSSINVWAVGENYSTSQALIEHWNGSSWSVVASPDTGSNANGLSSITALAPDNIWAVGTLATLSLARPFILHWNGVSWSFVPISNLSFTLPFDELSSVAAVSKNDIWAVGNANGGTDASVHHPLTIHWDGTKWSSVTSFTSAAYAILSGVTAPSSKSVWAVGFFYKNAKKSPLILHWSGSTWQASNIVRPPTNSELLGVIALSQSDAWSVGDTMSSTFQQLRVHWDGSTWQPR